MWEMYWDLVDRDGFDPDWYEGTGGNNLALQLIVDSLRYTSCTPSMTNQRDAILLADLVNNPVVNAPENFPQSDNECLIWEAFARRGLGYSADSGSPFDRFDQVEAFDLPPQCLAGPNFTLEVEPRAVEICAADNGSHLQH